MRRFNGHKNAERAARVRAARVNPARLGATYVDFEPYRKTTITYAVRIDEPFEVDTLEGIHTGEAGDYLAIGHHGEMYPIDAAVFADTYERAK